MDGGGLVWESRRVGRKEGRKEEGRGRKKREVKRKDSADISEQGRKGGFNEHGWSRGRALISM